MVRLTFIATVLTPSWWWNLRLCEFGVAEEATVTSELHEMSSNKTAFGCSMLGNNIMVKTKTTPPKMSATEWKQMLAVADQNWRDYIEQWPPAKSVRYDRATKRVVVQLVNGVRLEVPAAKLQGVASGTDRERADVHCIGSGTCLEWRSLDQHFSIEGLLTGRFGNKAWMEAIARKQSGASVIARSNAETTERRKRGVARKVSAARS